MYKMLEAEEEKIELKYNLHQVANAIIQFFTAILLLLKLPRIASSFQKKFAQKYDAHFSCAIGRNFFFHGSDLLSLF